MWQPLSSLLNFIGRIRITYRPTSVTMTIGNPGDRDAMDSTYWKDYVDTEKLFAVWGPVPGGPWEPYHCVPLFAALQTVLVSRIGPTSPDRVKEVEGNGHLGHIQVDKPLGTEWAKKKSWVILDLAGATSVAAGLRFIAGGFQPVCTFDNWPHPAGLIKTEIVLAQLLRYAAHVSDHRKYLTVDSPPIWLCDRNRLGTRQANVKEFDNRYYLDDSILPSPETLRKNGVEQIICVVPTSLDKPREDLCAYFRDLRKEGFNEIYGAAFQDPELSLFRFPETVFTIDFKQSGFKRNDAGGFGLLIPEPSSSGG